MKSSIYILNYNSASDACTIYTHKVPCYKLKPSTNLVQYKETDGECKNFTGTGYQIKLLLNELNVAEHYRQNLIYRINHNNIRVVVKLIPTKYEFIDFNWSHILNRLVWEHAELDNLMSWLSTLGGAYSSLGDDFERFADIAGRISIQQLKLALRIGDPVTVSRCKLYFVLSLIQKGQLVQANYLLRKEYKFAKSQLEHDRRLYRMCRGIWEKLKYTYQVSEGIAV